MMLIIAGSRTLDITVDFLTNLLHIYRLQPIEIVAGGCHTGPDHTAAHLAGAFSISYREFPADWDRYGKAAGPKRNAQMADYADALLLIWDGKSKGSANMKSEMKKRGKTIFEVILKGPQ